MKTATEVLIRHREKQARHAYMYGAGASVTGRWSVSQPNMQNTLREYHALNEMLSVVTDEIERLKESITKEGDRPLLHRFTHLVAIYAKKYTLRNADRVKQAEHVHNIRMLVVQAKRDIDARDQRRRISKWRRDTYGQ